MPSPFPGMNPYLEQDGHWHDFHRSFLPEARKLLVPQVVPNYVIKIEEHQFVHEQSADDESSFARADPATIVAAAGSAPAGPISVMLDIPPITRIPYLEILDRQNDQLVTVVELLSPCFKDNGTFREQYVARRRQYIWRNINLVEIDLLRGGPRMPMKGLAPCDYSMLVYRPQNWPSADVWPLQLADQLPNLPVPLRAGEPEASLDLQAVLHSIYDAAGYASYIYTNPPEPPLTAEQQAWAQQFLPKPPA